MEVKASYTVEAALICPLLCLILCGIITITLNLYTDIYHFSIEQKEQLEKQSNTTKWIRIEAMIEDLIQEE